MSENTAEIQAEARAAKIVELVRSVGVNLPSNRDAAGAAFIWDIWTTWESDRAEILESGDYYDGISTLVGNAVENLKSPEVWAIWSDLELWTYDVDPGMISGLFTEVKTPYSDPTPKTLRDLSFMGEVAEITITEMGRTMLGIVAQEAEAAAEAAEQAADDAEIEAEHAERLAKFTYGTRVEVKESKGLRPNVEPGDQGAVREVRHADSNAVLVVAMDSGEDVEIPIWYVELPDDAV